MLSKLDMMDDGYEANKLNEIQKDDGKINLNI